MAKATRFDLSRLEGCTGTVSDAPVAMARSLRPARAMQVPVDESPTPPELGEAPSPVPTIETVRAAQAAPTEESKAAKRTPAAASGPDRSALQEERRMSTANAPPVTQEECEAQERVRLGMILALTLSAWIPVLLIWWARMG